MRKFTALLVPAALIAGVSCSSSSGSTSPPASTPAPVAAADGGDAQATGRGGAGRGGRAGGGRGGGAPALTLEERAARRDSIAESRAATVKELMATIAGREDEPAGDVFKNVLLMKTVPAGQFLAAMDRGIGAGLGRGCSDCHVTTDWASDTVARKKTARTMMGIVNDINATLLPRMGPGRGGAPRTIQCMTCHRGGQAGRNAIIP